MAKKKRQQLVIILTDWPKPPHHVGAYYRGMENDDLVEKANSSLHLMMDPISETVGGLCVEYNRWELLRELKLRGDFRVHKKWSISKLD